MRCKLIPFLPGKKNSRSDEQQCDQFGAHFFFKRHKKQQSGHSVPSPFPLLIYPGTNASIEREREREAEKNPLHSWLEIGIKISSPSFLFFLQFKFYMRKKIKFSTWRHRGETTGGGRKHCVALRLALCILGLNISL